VIDAGALLLLAERLRGGVRCAPTHVLTPHAGEAAALLTTLGASISRTEVEAAPAACALDLARLTGGTVVLKGAPTLIAGPASDTIISSRFGLRKLTGLIITGFAHPNRTRKSMISPIGSICALGSMVKRPISRGVKSPRDTAARACAYSWNVMAMISPGMPSSISVKLNPNIY